MGEFIAVKVRARARVEKIEKDGSGGYRVWTRAIPEKGQANASVARLLARELGVAPNRLILRRGGSSSQKYFEVL